MWPRWPPARARCVPRHGAHTPWDQAGLGDTRGCLRQERRAEVPTLSCPYHLPDQPIALPPAQLRPRTSRVPPVSPCPHLPPTLHPSSPALTQRPHTLKPGREGTGSSPPEPRSLGSRCWDAGRCCGLAPAPRPRGELGSAYCGRPPGQQVQAGLEGPSSWSLHSPPAHVGTPGSC